MPDDPQTLLLLGEIRGGQKAIEADLTSIQNRVDDLASTASRIENETTRGFGEVGQSIARVEEQLEAHISEDDRRFSDVREDVTRAHRKIGAATGGAATAYGEGGDPVGLHQPMTTQKKAGLIGTILAGLAAAATWLQQHLTANGGQ